MTLGELSGARPSPERLTVENCLLTTLPPGHQHKRPSADSVSLSHWLVAESCPTHLVEFSPASFEL